MGTLQGSHSSRSIYSPGTKEQHPPKAPRREARKASEGLCVAPASDLCLESIQAGFAPGTERQRRPSVDQAKPTIRQRQASPRRKPKGGTQVVCRKGALGLGPNVALSLLNLS